MTDIMTLVEDLKHQIEARERELLQMREALAALQGVSGVTGPASREYSDLGIVEASRRFLTEVGKPMNSRELADALTTRGLRSKSRNVVATVYATLKNATKEFRRNERGEWELTREPVCLA
jgi:hypothetical protein